MAEGVAKSYVMDDDYFNVAKYFSGEEMTEIVMLVDLIGMWNRLNITVVDEKTGGRQVKESCSENINPKERYTIAIRLINPISRL